MLLHLALYKYFSNNGIKTDKQANNVNQFTLNGKSYAVFSGTLHYFCIKPQYWAIVFASYWVAKLNVVQRHRMLWNKHENTPSRFDFISDWLNLRRFLEKVKKPISLPFSDQDRLITPNEIFKIS